MILLFPEEELQENQLAHWQQFDSNSAAEQQEPLSHFAGQSHMQQAWQALREQLLFS